MKNIKNYQKFLETIQPNDFNISEKQCKYCNERFTTTKEEQVYCSEKCKEIDNSNTSDFN